MAFYEVEPFLQIDNNHVSDIYKENSVTFISIFMAWIIFDWRSLWLQPRTSGASDSEDAEGGTTVLGGVRCFLSFLCLQVSNSWN